MTSSEDESYADDFVDELTASVPAPVSPVSASASRDRKHRNASDDDQYSSDGFEDDVDVSAEVSREANVAARRRVASPNHSKSDRSDSEERRAATSALNSSYPRQSPDRTSRSSSRESSNRLSRELVKERGRHVDTATSCTAEGHQPSTGSRASGGQVASTDVRAGSSRARSSASNEADITAETCTQIATTELPAMPAEVEGHATRITQLPSAPMQWRAPMALDSDRRPGINGPRSETSDRLIGGVIESSARFLPPPQGMAPRTHDAVARHMQPHSWELASLGQEAVAPPRTRQSSSRGNTAKHASRIHDDGPLSLGAETCLVEHIAERFVLNRKSQQDQHYERAAYREMLQQVAWTALDTSIAQEMAVFLSKNSLAPVGSSEALCAFRRCLHAILTDERVLDIVEHQMNLHFKKSFSATTALR